MTVIWNNDNLHLPTHPPCMHNQLVSPPIVGEWRHVCSFGKTAVSSLPELIDFPMTYRKHTCAVQLFLCRRFSGINKASACYRLGWGEQCLKVAPPNLRPERSYSDIRGDEYSLDAACSTGRSAQKFKVRHDICLRRIKVWHGCFQGPWFSMWLWLLHSWSQELPLWICVEYNGCSHSSLRFNFQQRCNFQQPYYVFHSRHAS